jgi:uncharacterized protein YceK
MKRFLKFIFAFLLVANSTVQSKWGMSIEEPHQIGHTYSGIRHNLGSWCSNESEKINSGIKVFSYLINTIDYPVSLIMDTLFLPIDLIVSPKYSRLTPEQICKAHINGLQ